MHDAVDRSCDSADSERLRRVTHAWRSVDNSLWCKQVKMESVNRILHFKKVTALRVALFRHDTRDRVGQAAETVVDERGFSGRVKYRNHTETSFTASTIAVLT